MIFLHGHGVGTSRAVRRDFQMAVGAAGKGRDPIARTHASLILVGDVDQLPSGGPARISTAIQHDTSFSRHGTRNRASGLPQDSRRSQRQTTYLQRLQLTF
jgi:hypothetical protein